MLRYRPSFACWFLCLFLMFGSVAVRGQTVSDERQHLEDFVAVRGGILPCPTRTYRNESSNARSLTLDGAGNLYFVDDACVFKVDRLGTITRVAGGGKILLAALGSPSSIRATDADFQPSFLAVDDSGNIFISTTNAFKDIWLVKVDTSGTLTPVYTHCSDKEPNCTQCLLPKGCLFANGLAFDRTGNLYVSDASLNRIAKVSPTGEITTYVNSSQLTFGGPGGAPDGTVTTIPKSLAFDSTGTLYVVDSTNARVRVVGTDGSIDTLGRQDRWYLNENIADHYAAPWGLSDIAVGPKDDVYMAESGNQWIRKVSPRGKNTVAFKLNTSKYLSNSVGSYSKAPGAAALAVDESGNMYVYDNGNQQIVVASPKGDITLVTKTVTTARHCWQSRCD